MATTITLLYPTLEFDMNYYLTSHMPLVWKTWQSKGLKKYIVSELDPASGNCTQCTMEWTSVEAFQTAVKEDETAIMGDIPNYTQGKPSFIIGKIVGTS